MRNQSGKIGIYILIFCIGVFALSSCKNIKSNKQVPIVEKGVIDLRDWDFEKNGYINLKGQWEFYWNQHKSSDQFIDNNSDLLSGYIDVPGIWNDFDNKGEKLSGFGFATYRVRVIFKEKQESLGLKFLDMSSAFRAYINNDFITSTGVPGKTAEQATPFYSPRVVEFESDSETLDIIIYVSNFHHRLGGMWSPVLLGKASVLNSMIERQLVLSSFLFGTICIIGLYHLGLFWSRRKDKSTLYFGLFCLMIALRIITHGERYIVTLFPNIEYWLLLKLMYLSFYICVPVFSLYLNSLFPKEISKKICNLISIIYLIFSIIVLFSPVKWFSHTLPVSHFFTLVALIYGVYGLFKAIQHKQQGAYIFLAGFLVLLMTTVNDILYARLISSTGYLVPYGLFLFIFSQAFLISRRFSLAFEIVEQQGNELKKEIAERQKVSQELLKSEENYRLLIENQTDLVVKIDLEGRFQFVSPSYCEMFGKAESEYIGSEFIPMLYKEDQPPAAKAMEALYTPPHSAYVEQKALTKYGWKWLAWMGTAVLDENGKITSIVGVGRDITEKKEIESALKTSQETFLSVLDGVDATIYVADIDTYEILFMNNYMKETYRADLTGKTCYEVLRNTPRPCFHCNNKKLLNQNGEPTGAHVWNGENPISKRWYIYQDRAIKWMDGRYVKLQIATDFTDLKEMEEALRQAHKMESIGTLAGGIAHDFNNLLYMILGNTELVIQHIPSSNPEYTYLEEIKSASLRAAGVVRQLLNFTRKVDQQLIPIDVVIVIKEALEFLRSSIPSSIEIQKQLPDDDITILGDTIQINQIMMNLCTNASQAMKENGGVLKIIVENINLSEESVEDYPKLLPGKHVKIAISDSGSGIDIEIQNRIFDPYFTTKATGEGSGMGLAVVHGIVNNHNGDIFVDSESGKGATFTILFPVIDEKSEVKIKTIDEIPYGTERILFVDDEESITKMVEQILKRIGYQVETMLSPVEAIELFRSNPDAFDLFITDMTMPQMTGTKVAEKVKEIRSDIPVIICTGYSSIIDENKAKDLGVEGYISKPVSLLKIAKTIREVLD